MAGAGDLVLVSPGVYREDVLVPEGHPPFVLRGLDRNRVILDGEHRRANGIAVEADGVAVENLTIRDYLANGLIFAPPARYGGKEPLVGYRASYVTASNNGLYGVYALSARGGLFERIYASGSPDSGVYIGQCRPCDAVVRDSVGEWNMVGYENTNAGGNIRIVNSVWRRNRVGVAINSQTKELLAPQRELDLVGNVITDNDNPRAPIGSDAFGIGVVISGGEANLIARNAIRGHRVGVLVAPSIDGFTPRENVVRGNALAANATDLALSGTGSGACFSQNRFRTSRPAGIERALPCPTGGSVAPVTLTAPEPPGPDIDYTKTPRPPAQENMPNAATAPALIASPAPPEVAIDEIGLPGAR